MSGGFVTISAETTSVKRGMVFWAVTRLLSEGRVQPIKPAEHKTPVPNERPGGSTDEEAREHVRRFLEEDRARIAQTIHDQFGFLLMLLRTRLQSANDRLRRLSRSSGEAPSTYIGSALEELAIAKRLLQNLSDAARQLQNDLRPAPLESYGLATALESLKRTFAGAGLTVGLNIGDLAHRRFDTELETTAYWITQHALTNIVRHSGVACATVSVSVAQRGLYETLQIVIEDTGKGFAVGPIGNTFGITAMYDRAALIGGIVNVESAPGHGTRVTVSLPGVSRSSDASMGEIP